MSQSGKIPRPKYRKLRVFASDPSLQTDPEFALLSCVEVEIPWEDLPEERDDLLPKMAKGEIWTGCKEIIESKDGPAPGPIGEYLEVVDVDPASDLVYEPVNLNDPHLIEMHGLSPSDGNPQFHQQMVYAVSMKTIKIFERALGRLIMWAPNIPGHYEKKNNEEDREEYVRKLRIYPHAFRDANAFYSPDKKALLFGYFQATRQHSGGHLPGGMVFTCLSQDIIVHELTHAILDGMHRRFIEDSNPDVLAFHEAFADIIAIFQHFTYPDIVKHQIAQTRGNLADSGNFLGKLAKQFGKAIGRSDALRSAIGEDPDPTALESATECHDRGSILVAAVFDAFLTIYKNRTRDLVRMATGGTGVMIEGAELHPDLVNRLAYEASKTASHILNMCIRALDYLPPVDVTFGDFLRGLITADVDLVPDDRLCYRAAIIDAFRSHGIYPKDVKTLSVESLIWDGPEKEGREATFSFVQKCRNQFQNWDLTIKRNVLYAQIKEAQKYTHEVFKESWPYKSDVLGKALKKGGLNLPGDIIDEKGLFEVHSIRPVRRIGPDGQLLSDLLVEITQKRPGYVDKENLNDDKNLTEAHRLKCRDPHFWFRGGCTLLIDMKTCQVRYCIYKNINSSRRYRKQQKHLMKKYKFEDVKKYSLALKKNQIQEEPFAILHKHTNREDVI